MNTIRRKSAILLFSILASGFAYGQSASVSPSRLYFNAGPGQSQTRQITVTNNSETPQSFTVSFADFSSPGTDGKTELVDPGENPNSASRWLSASPSLLELNAGESRDVEIILQLPDSPDAAKVIWATTLVKLARERTQPPGLGEDAMGFGIMHTFQFVIHVFQTPPNITFKDARILAFEDIGKDEDGKRTLMLHVENTGEAIIDVAAYLELTNLRTGETNRERARAFTTLPGHSRRMNFNLPENLAPGNYSVLGVVDYGDREAVIAAELNITVE